MPEALVVAVGIVLRLTLAMTFPPERGYDFPYHWSYVQWFAERRAIPPVDALHVGFHPPLFYAIAGELVRRGVGAGGVQRLSVLLGCVRLLLVWLGAELYLGSRRARLLTLAIATILPASVHVDGLVSGEPLCAALAAATLLLLPLVFVTALPRATALAALGGFTLGLAVLAKASALTIVFATALAVLLQFVHDGSGGWRGRARRLSPWLVGLLVLAGVSGWYFVRNERLYGKPVLTSFDGQEKPPRAWTDAIPYIGRRPPVFVYGWTTEIYEFPFYPSAALGHARFFPLLVATTFSDYYNHGFAALHPGSETFEFLQKPMPVRVLPFALASTAGGSVIALVVAVTWVVALASSYRQRAWPLVLLLLVPLLAVLAQLDFAIRYPHDWLGVVKGAYLQFASGPLCALFGLGVAWLLEGRWRRLLAAVPFAALGMVALYTFECRLL